MVATTECQQHRQSFESNFTDVIQFLWFFVTLKQYLWQLISSYMSVFTTQKIYFLSEKKTFNHDFKNLVQSWLDFCFGTLILMFRERFRLTTHLPNHLSFQLTHLPHTRNPQIYHFFPPAPSRTPQTAHTATYPSQDFD